MGEADNTDHGRQATVLDSTAVALWQYDSASDTILWGNPAARNLWGCASLAALTAIDSRPLYTALSSSERPSQAMISLEFTLYGHNIRCRAQHIGGHQWLLEQLPDTTPGIQRTSELVSHYRTDGRLQCRSKNSRRLFCEDRTFMEHFIDKPQARQLWRTMESSGHARGDILVHTRMGPRWHSIELHRPIAPGEPVELIETDLYQYLANYDIIDSMLREQQVIQEHAGVGIAFIRERRIIRCNHRFAEIFGYQLEDLIGKLGVEVYENAEVFAEVGREAYPLLNRGESYSKRLKMRHKLRGLIWCNIHGKMITPGQPEQGFIWIIHDIDDEVRAEQTLQQVEHEHRLILEHATIGISFLKDRVVTRCNHKFAELFGYQPEELIGTGTQRLHRSEEDYGRIGRDGYRRLKRGLVYESEEILRHRDGSELWADLRAKAINPDDLSQGTIWIAMDISRRKRAEIALNEARQHLEERVKERTRELYDAMKDLHQEIADRRIAEERIRHLAHHDPLTGLPNRSMLEERMMSALLQAERNNEIVAVLFIDLDRFKTINDSLGHQEGDQLLKHAASRFKQCIRSTDIVSRLGGDEFVIILDHLDSRENIDLVVEKVRDKFRQEMQLGLQEVIVTLSIGVSVFPHDGTEPRTLLKNADAAMYHAKEKGRNRYQFFDPHMNESVSERVTLEHALHQAIREQQFQLYYQPQVNLTTHEIVGVEALVRWVHPEKGMISPMDFIPLAEDTGQILELGQWVLQEACHTAQRWQEAGLPAISMSVNLSALQIQSDDFLAQVKAALQDSRLDPHRLDLEITESSIMRNVDETINKLTRLHELGIQLSIDDFGTGYSSLSYLKRFPLDKLKIDRSFVSEIDVDQDDAMICNTIISMAKSLNLSVVAEGAETNAHLSCLRAYGCDIYQGYYFSKPLPESEMAALLQRYSKAQAVCDSLPA